MLSCEICWIFKNTVFYRTPFDGCFWEYVHMRGEMNSYQFEISNRRVNKICSHEISFLSKWPIWNPYRFEFHFASIHVNTSKELTEHQSEIFSRNEISYRFEFISPLMWTYSDRSVFLIEYEITCCYKKIALLLKYSDNVNINKVTFH